MEKIEMAEKLQQKAGVSLEEAKEVLERCDWDLLDAMIILEKEGRTAASASHGSSVREDITRTAAAESEGGSGAKAAESSEGGWQHFCEVVKKLVRKGMSNRFVVKRKGSVIVDLPVLVSLIIMVAFFWLTVILLIVGIFTHCEYSFQGAELGKDSINDGIRKATDAAQNFADQLKNKDE